MTLVAPYGLTKAVQIFRSMTKDGGHIVARSKVARYATTAHQTAVGLVPGEVAGHRSLSGCAAPSSRMVQQPSSKRARWLVVQLASKLGSLAKRVAVIPSNLAPKSWRPEVPIRSWHPSRSDPVTLRTLFLSDLHLGNVGSRADMLLEFLQGHPAEIYYLVGDILDLWLPFGTEWGAAHQGVIDHFQKRQRDGASVVFVRGNHDPDPAGTPAHKRLPAVPVNRVIHQTADGRRYLVLHGEGEDFGSFRMAWLETIGIAADQVLRRIDRAVVAKAAGLGMTASGVMPRMMLALNTLLYARRSHEERLVALARKEGLNGVICGHFHLPALHSRHGQVYANCGDWLDNFTALAEDHSGKLCLLKAATAAARREMRVGMPPPIGVVLANLLRWGFDLGGAPVTAPEAAPKVKVIPE